ncbi:MAG: putative b-glycosidase, glycoside hydrolase family 8 protein, partial [Verrucomicrobiota bacterium]
MRNILLWIGRFLVAVVLTTAANAGSIKLKWDHSVGGEGAFYRVYLGDQPGTYKVAVNTPMAHARIDGLLGGRAYYVTVRSVNSVGLESENSPEIRVELPEEKLSVAVWATSSYWTPWGVSSEPIAPATLNFRARVGVPLDELDKIEIWVAYRKPDGSRGAFYQELKEPPFEVEVSEIGGASQFAVIPFLVLKTGLKIQGSVNDGWGFEKRIQPRMPRHLLRVTSTAYPIYPGIPVDIDLLVDDTGMPVRTVVFKRGNTVIGEDSVPPYSIRWINSSSGYSEVHAEVYYHGVESHISVASEIIGINHVPHPARVAVEAQGISAGRVLLRGQLSNCEGLPISKMEFLEGATVIAEDVNPPYEFPWQTTPGRSCEITCRASFGTGHVLESVPIAVTIPERNPDPTIVLRLPSAPGPWTAPATVEMEALVDANGNTVQRVQFLEGSVVLGEDTAAPYVFSWSGVSARSTTVSARLFYEDSATIDSSPIPVVVVNPRPTAVLNVSVPNGGWIAPATVSMEVAVSANGNGIQRVQFLEGGAVIGEATASPYRFDWVGVSARSTSVSARVFYGEGLTVDAAPTAVVVGNPKPTAVLNVSVPNGGWIAPATVAMEVAVNANGNGIQRVQFLEGGAVIGEATASPYRFDWVGVSARSTSVSAR